MIGIPTLIAGLILILAGSAWFPGALTIGIILTAISAVVIIAFAVIAYIIGKSYW